MPVDPTTGPRMISRYLRDHEHEIKRRLLCEGASVPARHGISYAEAVARDEAVWDWLADQAMAQPAYVRWECHYIFENIPRWERREARQQKRLARLEALYGEEN